jgi:hypothetical protein
VSQVPDILSVHGASDPVSNEGLITAFVAVGVQALGEAELIVAVVEVGVRVSVGVIVSIEVGIRVSVRVVVSIEVGVRVSISVVVSMLVEELGFSEPAEVETEQPSMGTETPT